MLHDTLCFRGYETLEVAGQPRRVAVIADTLEGTSGDVQRAERILSYDVETRTLVGLEFRLIRGLLPTDPGWRALRLSRGRVEGRGP